MTYIYVKFQSMVKAKKELFDSSLQEAAKLFKSLGHPARLVILDYLSKCNSCISGDISELLPLSRTTVNQHLKELKNAGLIKGEVEGVKVNYCLNNESIERLREIAFPFLDSLKPVDSKKCKQT